MGILSTVFGSDKVISKGLDLFDDLFETKAEAAESKVTLLTAYAPFKVTQRYLAFMYSGTYLLCFFGVMVCHIFEIGDTQGIVDIVVSFNIGWIAMAIITFYFGGGFIESAKKPLEKMPTKRE